MKEHEELKASATALAAHFVQAIQDEESRKLIAQALRALADMLEQKPSE